MVDDVTAAIAVGPARCTLIGDSPTDIQAAHAAKVRSIGYANRPGKTAALASLTPTAITTTIMLLADICTN